VVERQVAVHSRSVVAVRGALSSYRGQLAIALLLALAVRLWMIVSSHGMMDGDEAVLGIQAEDILRGAHPIYFAGQPYMGTWDAYLLAPIVAIFGPSGYATHAVTLAESLLLVPLAGALARRIYGQRARFAAMLLTALPPIYVGVTELRMLGGYVETLVFGSMLLLLALHIADRWREERGTLLLWIAFGLAAGLALWIDVLIAYYLLACALWLALPAIVRARHGLRERAQWWWTSVRTAAGATCSLLLGAMPAIIYGFQNHFSNVTAVTQHPAWLDHVGIAHGRIAYYLALAAIPRVTGVEYLWAHLGGPLTLGLGVCAGIFAATALAYGVLRLVPSAADRRSAWYRRVIQRARDRWVEVLPLLLIAIVLVVFWRTPNELTALAAQSLHNDGARYALPLTTGLTLLLAGLFAWLAGRAGLGEYGRSDWGAGIGASLAKSPQLLASGALALLLVVYAVPYIGSNAEDALQSPETSAMVFPAEHADMLTYFKDHHIRYVWSNQWMCHLIMYLEDEQALCGEYVDVYYNNATNRFPQALSAVAAADRPSFVIDSDPAKGEPLAAQALDKLGVTYTMARFGGSWVITPLSRTVQPDEIATALRSDY
jgi:hypothetical protein